MSLVETDNTGSAVNDYLIWAWGWEINATLYAGYCNELMDHVLSPGVPFVPSEHDWVAQDFYPANSNAATGAPYPAPWHLGGLSDPYYVGGGAGSDGCDLAFSQDFAIQTNYNANNTFLFANAWCNSLQWFGLGNPGQISVAPGELGGSFNPIPGKSYGAGKFCLLMTGNRNTSPGDVNPEVPKFWTPHIGKYNLAVSASEAFHPGPFPGDFRFVASHGGANVTRGPRQGWIQTSYKSLAAQYEFRLGLPATFLGLNNNAGGDGNPIIGLWDEYEGHPDGNMLLEIRPVVSDNGFADPAATNVPREIELVIAPHWAGASVIDTFLLPSDLDWHRIAIQFHFDNEGVALFCGSGISSISASVFLDGAWVAGGVRCNSSLPPEPWQDWNRVAFGAGVAEKFLDQEGMINPPNFPYPANSFYSCFGMHDHVLIWGTTGSVYGQPGTQDLYIQGVKPNDDVEKGFWEPHGNNITPGEDWSTIDERSDPDVWDDYEAVSLPVTQPPAVNALANRITQSNIPAVMDTHTYDLGLQNTSDVNIEWRPSNIKGVQQISINTYQTEAPEPGPREFIRTYTTMSIGSTLVASWPSNYLDRATLHIGSMPDAAFCNVRPYSNFFLVFSSASFDGDLWTYQEIDLGTGSLYAEKA